MTSPFEVDTAPDDIEILCPRCGAPACFTFARARTIESKTLREELARDPAIELETVTGWANRKCTIAVLFAHLGRPAIERAAPASRWGPRVESRGTCRCSACGGASKHTLSWPADAAFACEVRGRTLWAWTRRHAVALRDFIASKERRAGPFELFLMHVPTHFLTRRCRDVAVKKLDALLEGTSR